MTQSPIIAQILFYRYPILFPLAIIEGPIVMMFSGFLVRIGTFDFWPAYLVLMAGDLTGDILWYLAGKHGARKLIERYGHFFGITKDNLEKAEAMFQEHQARILFLSKITTGFGLALATLIAAGAANVPFKKYLAINFFGEFIWAGALMGIGFFFGNFYGLVSKGFRWAFIAGMIALIAGLAYGFGKVMKNKFVKSFK